jgi:general stress protein 26
MRKIKTYIFFPLFISIFFLSSQSTFPQVEKITSNTESILETAKLVMKSAKYCFLITLDESGHPIARLMDPFEPGTGMKIWMGTNKNTRKIEQIKKDPGVTLAYYSAEGMGYVTLAGEAQIVTDPELKDKWWKEEWQALYPGGKRSETYVLIKFSPSRLEVMDISRKVFENHFRPAIITLENSIWIHEK